MSRIQKLYQVVQLRNPLNKLRKKVTTKSEIRGKSNSLIVKTMASVEKIRVAKKRVESKGDK